MTKEMGKSPLIVTRGDGVPLPDQAAALEEFKRQCRQRTPFELLVERMRIHATHNVNMPMGLSASERDLLLNHLKDVPR